MGAADDRERFTSPHGPSREAGRLYSGDVQQGRFQLDNCKLQVSIEKEDFPDVGIGGLPEVCGHLERAVLGQMHGDVLVGQHDAMSEIHPGSWKDAAGWWQRKEER